MLTSRFWLLLAVAFATGLAGIAAAFSDTHEAEEPAAAPSVEPVNAVLGDMSYIARFGHPPGPHTDETVRLRTHLAYVEHLLRTRPTDHLTAEQQAARKRHLDRLHEYWKRGRFPHNYGTASGRQPTFIDREGRICAVGYLIAESAGWDVARRINATYKHAYIEEIDAPALDEWVASSGFTTRELAMIQPQYGDDGCACVVDGENEPMHQGAEIGVMALNASAAVLNGVLSARGQRSYVASGAGLALGATGLAVGLSDRANYSTGDAIFAGASILMSTWNLAAPLQHRTSASKSASLVPDTHVTAIPVRGTAPKVGLSLQWDF